MSAKHINAVLEWWSRSLCAIGHFVNGIVMLTMASKLWLANLDGVIFFVFAAYASWFTAKVLWGRRWQTTEE